MGDDAVSFPEDAKALAKWGVAWLIREVGRLSRVCILDGQTMDSIKLRDQPVCFNVEK